MDTTSAPVTCAESVTMSCRSTPLPLGPSHSRHLSSTRRRRMLSRRCSRLTSLDGNVTWPRTRTLSWVVPVNGIPSCFHRRAPIPSQSVLVHQHRYFTVSPSHSIQDIVDLYASVSWNGPMKSNAIISTRQPTSYCCSRDRVFLPVPFFRCAHVAPQAPSIYI